MNGGRNSERGICAADGVGNDDVMGGPGRDIYTSDPGDSVSGAELSTSVCPPFPPK